MFNAINLYLFKVFTLLILIKLSAIKLSANVNTNENKFNNQPNDPILNNPQDNLF